MYGPTIVGFGSYGYTYDTGHSGKAPIVAFSPRSANICAESSKSSSRRLGGSLSTRPAYQPSACSVQPDYSAGYSAMYGIYLFLSFRYSRGRT